MNRSDKLITQARRQTENEEFSDTTGISTDELIQYLNDGQNRIFSKITIKHPGAFVVESPDINVTPGQESYSLPSDVYLDNRISIVEFSSTSDIRDFTRLQPASLHSRENGFAGFPNSYIRRSGKVLLQPVPSMSGTLRVNYQRRIASLDIRRGSVASVVLDTATNTITSLTLETTDNDYDSPEINDSDHLCVIDVLGNQKMVKIQIDSMVESTGVVTINSGFTFADGETIAVGDKIVTGDNTSTHSELQITCERYLIAYLAWKILKRDSSEDATEQAQEVFAMEKDIVESYSDITDDITLIPLISMDGE